MSSAGHRRRRSRLWLMAFGVLVFGGGLGCAQTDHDSNPAALGSAACVCPAGEAPIVDPVLLAFLSKARAAHHEADLAESSGDRDRAVRVLERLVKGLRPGSPEPLPEAREVLADAHARLANLRSLLGDFDGAIEDIDRGLKLAVMPTYFRGNLIDVRGLVEQRRAQALEQAGDSPGAERARQAALKSFDEAIGIHEEVLARALGAASAPADPAAR